MNYYVPGRIGENSAAWGGFEFWAGGKQPKMCPGSSEEKEIEKQWKMKRFQEAE